MNNTNNNFKHQYAAHCESGVMSSMLSHHGLQISEAMVFGLSGALGFAYLPFIKMGGMPLIAYRTIPRAIIKRLQKNIGITMKLETFSKPEEGTKRLDKLINEGKIVGAQSSIFWLPYFPDEMRFHMNIHNLLIFGKEGENYKISDPVFEHPVEADERSLQKARFNKGAMEPKGLLYYPTFIPVSIDYKKVIPKTIKKTAKLMLYTPVPIAGLRGIRALAGDVRKLTKKDRYYSILFLGHIVRMQEEIGTGGAGFRYMYASYLQEASHLLDNKDLMAASEMMTAVGDSWREFALMIARVIRSNKDELIDFLSISKKIESIANQEAIVYRKLLVVF